MGKGYKKMEKIITVEQLREARAIAMCKLFGLSKAGPVTIAYCGKTQGGLWLWEVTQDNKYIAKQGTEEQVLESICFMN